MRIVLFTHSLVSDWNHGNAHFLRGLARGLMGRGHEVIACERWRSWSTDNLYADHGTAPLMEFARRFPDLVVRFYGEWDGILEEVDDLTRGADLVLVHEFSDPELVGAVAHARQRRRDFVALFHDTHHRAVTAAHQIARFPVRDLDGILAFGQSLADVYRTRFGATHVWTFHEAADTTVFRPLDAEKTDDVVWIGNWGDDERSGALLEYLMGSARALPGQRFVVHGVRYPKQGRRAMAAAGIEFRGWIPNFRVPEAFARARLTMHIPRGPYVAQLPGIPTIRPFEAMACGVPLLSSPWEDREGLFRAGVEYVLARSPAEMRAEIQRLLRDEDARLRLAEHGRAAILARHTCDHRAEELEHIYAGIAATL